MRVDKGVRHVIRRHATGVTDLELAVRQSRTGSELARSILLALLAVCCIELVLGQRFGK